MSSYISAELRRLVHERAKGCCEYCLQPESFGLTTHEVDHIIAEKHGGPTQTDNLALSCALCNKRKGSDLASLDPQTGAVIPLYHPRRDRWNDHFELQAAEIVPLTATGRTTVQFLQLNLLDRLAEREILISAGVLKSKTQ